MNPFLFTFLNGIIFFPAIAQQSSASFNTSINHNTLTYTINQQPTGLNAVFQSSQNTMCTMDCNTSFWTINMLGEIQQWHLTNGGIEGGEVILTGPGNSGLAFCGESGTETFYSSLYPNTGIARYNSDAAVWETIPTAMPLINNGGFGNYQYYFGYETGQKKLYFFDGTSVTLIEELTDEFYTAADIAVDSAGRAWVFKGDEITTTNQLCVYDNQGLVSSYNLNFDSSGTYGSFFINDQLYVGRTVSSGGPESDDFIVPINVTETTASFGAPIEFPYNSFYDMASCNGSELSIKSHSSDNAAISIFPNPSNGVFNINSTDEIYAVKVYSIDGKIIKTVSGSNKIDLSELPNQSYIISIQTPKKVYNEIIVKK